MRQIELWTDSFHEGDWACAGVAMHAQAAGGAHSERLASGFVPVHDYRFADGSDFELTVYGSYGSWDPVPRPIKSLLEWGKPDLVAYDSEAGKILFAVEETAAVPTGNQALQRCERLYGAARLGIPFWYLLSEFGQHVDGGVRRDSIWPTVMALKLTQDKALPSVVLHYSDLANPESYSVGAGQAALFSSLLTILRNYSRGDDPLSGLGALLESQYESMLAFVRTQWARMLHFLPGIEALDDESLAANYAGAATNAPGAEDVIWSTRFLSWPRADDLPPGVGDLQTERPLIKADPLCLRLESDIAAGNAYGLSQNAGSRPQPAASLSAWITQQNALFDAGPAVEPPATLDLSLADFPATASGNRHVTTATRTVFLYDRWGDVRASVERAYPRLTGKLAIERDDCHALVYISNSIKPGRIFGDPFTGQIAAFAVAFGALDPEPRVVLAYFPHQAFSQALGRTGGRTNKGLLVMAELTSYLLFGGGVAVQMPERVAL